MAEYEMKYHVVEGQEDTAQVRYEYSRPEQILVKILYILVELVITSVVDPVPDLDMDLDPNPDPDPGGKI